MLSKLTKILTLEVTIFGLKMIEKSGLEFLVLASVICLNYTYFSTVLGRFSVRKVTT